MRALFVRLHRWFGLTAAVFLFVAGATGAVISWDHELDAWLNPQLFRTVASGPQLDEATLRTKLRIESLLLFMLLSAATIAIAGGMPSMASPFEGSSG